MYIYIYTYIHTYINTYRCICPYLTLDLENKQALNPNGKHV